MKKFKKIMSIILAATMTMAMGATTFAATGDEPSASDYKTVYVYNIEENVTVKAYQLIDATYDEKGNGLIGYVVADGLTIEDLESPTAEEITDIAAGVYDGTITALETKTLSYSETEQAYYADLEAGMWLILVWDSNAIVYNPMIVSNWYTDANLASSLTAGSVDADGDFYEGQWTDEEDVADRTYESVEVIYAKSDTVSVDKEITNYTNDDSHTADFSDGADYSIGETVSFKLTSQMPDYSDAYFDVENYTATFTIVDDLSVGFDQIDASTITITVGTTSYTLYYLFDSNSVAGATTTGTEYTVSRLVSGSSNNLTEVATVTLFVANDGSQELTIDFAESFIDEHAKESIAITYSAVLNDDAEVVGNTSAAYNVNEVNIIYSNNPTSTINTADIGGGDEVYVYTFSITDEIVKVMPKGTASSYGNTVTVENALAGAEFTIYTDEECTTPYLNMSSECGEDAYVSTSDENGYISFTGLEEGTYYITETESPSDYMINDTVYKIVISATYDNSEGSTTEGMLTSYTISVTDLDTGDEYSNTYEVTYTTVTKTYEASNGETSYTWYEVDSVSVSASQNPIAIVDPDLIKLPSTGGIGVYIIIGISIVILSGCAIIVTKKKKSEY